MKPQKSQRREQPLRLHILGFSCLRARDLSLKNTPARLQRLRDRKPGGFTLVYVEPSSTFRRLSTSFSTQSYGKIRISAMESSLALFLTSPPISRCNSQSVPFHQHPTSLLATTFAKRFVFLSARQSIDQVFTTQPACACLKAIFKSMFSYSQTSSSSVRC